MCCLHSLVLASACSYSFDHTLRFILAYSFAPISLFISPVLFVHIRLLVHSLNPTPLNHIPLGDILSLLSRCQSNRRVCESHAVILQRITANPLQSAAIVNTPAATARIVFGGKHYAECVLMRELSV